MRLVYSPAAEATLSHVLYNGNVRRLQRVYVPVGAHGLAWCEVVRFKRDELVAAVDRVDGANTGAATRASGAAVGTAVSQSVLYDRFRRALNVLSKDARPETRGRLRAADVFGRWLSRVRLEPLVAFRSEND